MLEGQEIILSSGEEEGVEGEVGAGVVAVAVTREERVGDHRVRRR